MAYMPYTSNPHLPRLRMDAANLVLRHGWSTRDVARHYRFNQSTIVRWVEKARLTNRNLVPTESSRPRRHPRELPDEIVNTILAYRRERSQCAEILHRRLTTDGYRLSLSSVKRTLQRHGVSRFSRWKKWHQAEPRPIPETPGILVQIDTIHDGPHDDRLYVYTLLDVCSRFAYAWAGGRITTHHSLRFVRDAVATVPFAIHTLQSDHGSEFSKWFTTQIEHAGIAHRHSRVRQPNDNAHLERFNRTTQEECLLRLSRSLRAYQQALPEYLRYYNTERPHMGLAFKTPIEVMRSY